MAFFSLPTKLEILYKISPIKNAFPPKIFPIKSKSPEKVLDPGYKADVSTTKNNTPTSM
jgi:hypothetical protein